MCYGIALISALILLVLSFLILISLKKNDSKKLKIVGYILAILLWISTIFVLIGHFYGMKTHSPQMMKDNKCHHQMMPQK